MKKKLLTVTLLFLIAHITQGQNIRLGSTATFAIYTASGAINNVGNTVIRGDVGTHAGAFNGFPLGIINGATHIADAASAQALIDVNVLNSDLSTQNCGITLGVGLGNNQTLSPNVYCTGAASTINGNLILNGQNNPNSLFIIKIGGALATAPNSTVSLINGASLCNVFFQVNERHSNRCKRLSVNIFRHDSREFMPEYGELWCDLLQSNDLYQ